MRLKLLLTGLGLCGGLLLFGQEIARNVLGPNGDYNSTNQMTLEWTIGEIVTQTVSSDQVRLTQGFHQSYFDEHPIVLDPGASRPGSQLRANLVSEDFSVTVSPNPVSDYLSIALSGHYKGKLKIVLLRMSTGTQHYEESTTSPATTEIAMSQHPAGAYMIIVLNDQQEVVSSFKIIKTQ